MSRCVLLPAALCCLLLAPWAPARTISLNFTGDADNPGGAKQLGAADVAGVAPYATANWNNTVVGPNNVTSSGAHGQATLNFKDNQGSQTTARIVYQTHSIGGSWGSAGAVTPDERMMANWLRSPYMIVEGIPYSRYSVVVYFTPNQANVMSMFDAALISGDRVTRRYGQTHAVPFQQFVQVSENASTPAAREAGNYTVFRGLTLPSFRFVTENAVAPFGSFGVGGIQIVEEAALSDWTGIAGDQFSQAGNWFPPEAPGKHPLVELTFGELAGRFDPRADAAWTAGALRFTAGAPAYRIRGFPLTLHRGLFNQGDKTHILENDVTVAAGQIWDSGPGVLSLTGLLQGNGTLVKAGTGTIQLSQVNSFSGVLELREGTFSVLADRGLNTDQPLIMNGGTLANHSGSLGFGALHLLADSKLQLGNGPARGELRFSRGVHAAGLLSVQNWKGNPGQSGTGDTLVVAENPGSAFLNAMRFVGYSPGVIRLASGELVPKPPGTTQFTWSGGGPSPHWSQAANWVEETIPLNNASARLVFPASASLRPQTSQPWDIAGLVFEADAGSYALTGSRLVLRHLGIENRSSQVQTIENNLLFGADQDWHAALGPLQLAGSVEADGYLLHARGPFSIRFATGGLRGVGVLKKSGSGTLFLGGAGNFGGRVEVLEGVLRLESPELLQDATTLELAPGSALHMHEGAETVGHLLGGGAIQLGGGTLAFGRDGSTNVYAGEISGIGTVRKRGNGQVTWTSEHRYEGSTEILGGVLRIAQDSGIPPGSSLHVAAGAVLDMTDRKTRVQTLSGGGTLLLGNGTLTAGGGAPSVFSGILDGGGGFMKTGTGALSLSGQSFITGPTVVEQGELVLSGAYALGATLSVEIQSGGRLSVRAENALSTTAELLLAGGFFDAGGFAASFSTLKLLESSTLMVPEGSPSRDLQFGQVFYTPEKTLQILGWRGGSAGATAGRVILHSFPGEEFLKHVTFSGFAPGALVLPSGELVPAGDPLISEPPRIVSIRKQPGSVIELEIAGSAGARYSLEESSNLATWSHLKFVQSTTETVLVLDSMEELSHRFYRVRIAD